MEENLVYSVVIFYLGDDEEEGPSVSENPYSGTDKEHAFSYVAEEGYCNVINVFKGKELVQRYESLNFEHVNAEDFIQVYDINEEGSVDEQWSRNRFTPIEEGNQ